MGRWQKDNLLSFAIDTKIGTRDRFDGTCVQVELRLEIVYDCLGVNALDCSHGAEEGSTDRLPETISHIGVPDPCSPRQVAVIASPVPRHEGNAWGRRIRASLMDPFAALNAGSRPRPGMYITFAQARSSASRGSSICLLLRPTSYFSPGTERTEVPGIQ